MADDNSSRPRSGFASQEYWTPLRRKEKSEWAKRENEKGNFGGKQPGAGRPRKKTVAEYVAEEAAKHGDVVWRELFSMLKHKSPGVKLGAIDRINKMEADVQKNMRDDEKMVASLGGKDLKDALLEELAGFGADITLDDSDVQDADVVELEEENGNGNGAT